MHEDVHLPRQQPRMQAAARALPHTRVADLACQIGHGVVERQRRTRHDGLSHERTLKGRLHLNKV